MEKSLLTLQMGGLPIGVILVIVIELVLYFFKQLKEDSGGLYI